MGDAKRQMEQRADRALRIIAEDVLGDANRIVLLDEGTLAGSGHLEPETGVAQAADGRRTVSVVYSTPYAQRRHQETHRQDGTPIQPSVPGRMPKWLEITLKAKAPRYEAALARILEGG